MHSIVQSSLWRRGTLCTFQLITSLEFVWSQRCSSAKIWTLGKLLNYIWVTSGCNVSIRVLILEVEVQSVYNCLYFFSAEAGGRSFYNDFLNYFFPCAIFSALNCAGAQRAKFIGQASTLPCYLFQNVKETDYTQLPDGMSVTVKFGPYGMEYFFFFTYSDIQQIQGKYWFRTLHYFSQFLPQTN